MPPKAQEEIKKKEKKPRETHEYKFVKPSQSMITKTIILIVIGIIFFIAVPFVSQSSNNENLKRIIPMINLESRDIQTKFFVNEMRKNSEMESYIQVNENEYNSTLHGNGMLGMYYLNSLGKEIPEEEIMKLYREYGFMDDLEIIMDKVFKEKKEEEDKEDEFGGDIDSLLDRSLENEEEYVETYKPQTIRATYFAHEILKKNGKFEEYKKTENYKKSLKFILAMQTNSTGFFTNDKGGYSDLRIMYYTVSLLVDAKEVKEYKEKIEKALNNVREFYKQIYLPDGGFDLTIEGKNSTCIGTGYAYLAFNKLGLDIRPNTHRFMMKCDSVNGPLLDLHNPDGFSVESGYLISEILKIMPENYKTENLPLKDVLRGISILFVGFGISLIFVESYPSHFIKEYFISVSIFIVCGIVSIIFMDKTYLLFLVFPVVVMGYTHYRKWIGPFVKDEFYSTVGMMPAAFAVALYFLLSKMFPAFFFTFKFIPFMWILYVIGARYGVPIGLLFFAKKNHSVDYYFSSTAIGFSVMIILMFSWIALSAERLFIINIIGFSCGYFTFFVAYPAVAYILSMFISGFAIPKFKRSKGGKRE